MKIATLNVNSIRARLDAVAGWLAEQRPDVLALQETKVRDEAFPEEAFAKIGYHAVFRGEKTYNGVALLSTLKPARVWNGFTDGGPADETRLIAAAIGPVHVVNTYVPQGRAMDHPMFTYKLEWFSRLRAWFDQHFSPRGKLLWVGDLNVAPEAMDIHNAEQQANHVCFHESVRAAFAHARDWGFVDVFRRLHPEGGQFTFFDYRTKDAVTRNLGWRVDHILATAPLAARARRCTIDRELRRQPKASDHTAVLAEFAV